MRILITGSRDWTDYTTILSAIHEALPPGTDHTVVQGEARGADKLSAEAARFLGLRVESYPADWEKYGKRAGYVRNAEMVSTGVYLWCLAFIKNNSKGATMCAKLAEKHGIPVRYFRAD